MDIETKGAIKLLFPNPSLTMVYFEALANALDAGATEVFIDIELKGFDQPETLKLKVTDNGEGFTDENFNRFKTLLKPRDQHRKGIGRLVFLKYFDRVEVMSIYGKFRREFIFKNGFDNNAKLQALENEQENRTILTFVGFVNHKINAYDDIKPAALKSQIIEQFLPMLDKFKREQKPFKIAINLKTDESNAQHELFSHETTIVADDLPALTKLSIQADGLDLFSAIDMYYHIESGVGKGSCVTAVNIDDRTIPVKLVPPSSFPLGYRCLFLFESEMFASNADSSRQKLLMPDGISESRLNRVLKRAVGKTLAEKIPEIAERNKKTEAKLENQFPHLLGYFESDTVGLIEENDALDIAQQSFFQEQKKILQCEKLSNEDYRSSLELSSRSLTEYILYREKIIQRMGELTEENTEKEIHDLIVPRGREFLGQDLSNDVYQNNAWLLDDKFMTFQTILSEKRMDALINAIRLDDEFKQERGRPDISMIFSADPDHAKAVDVVVIEIKKKTNQEKDNLSAINQLLGRARKLVSQCENIERV